MVPTQSVNKSLHSSLLAPTNRNEPKQTVSAAQSFILAMAIYPEIQKKAQQELDSVLGGERLPSFDDHDSLPFINAIVKETLRWKPVLPIGKWNLLSLVL